jgi:hypothetical protein
MRAYATPFSFPSKTYLSLEKITQISHSKNEVYRNKMPLKEKAPASLRDGSWTRALRAIAYGLLNFH